jgi:hypothetical protein
MDEKQKYTIAIIRVVPAVAVVIAALAFAYRTGQPLYIKAAWVVSGFLTFSVLVMLVYFARNRTKP